LSALADRLRSVRVACGDWLRVLGDSVTVKHGMTAILLDPPYASQEHSVDYSGSEACVSASVRLWAIQNGQNPLLRIALCGYDGEHDMPTADGWTSWAWKAQGGYGSQGDGRGRENSERELVWFSPHCVPTHDLFSGLDAR
jgi:hypothetical protein